MKYILLVISITIFSPLHSFVTQGSLTQEFFDTTTLNKDRQQYFLDRLLYSTGGVNFPYPINLGLTPTIVVSLQILSSFNPAVTYIATFQADVLSATVFVNKITYDGSTTIVEEAPTGSVIVSVWAVDTLT